MVLKSFTAEDVKYFLLAIFLHFGLNFVVVYSLRYGIIFPEIIVTLFAIAFGFWELKQIKTIRSTHEKIE
jgi:hypothetical protein